MPTTTLLDPLPDSRTVASRVQTLLRTLNKHLQLGSSNAKATRKLVDLITALPLGADFEDTKGDYPVYKWGDDYMRAIVETPTGFKPDYADDTVEKILQLYQSFTDKQIFIAFDKDGSYSNRTRQHIEQTQVVHLGEGEHALYGFAWNRQDAKPPKEDHQDAEGRRDDAETLRTDQWPD